MRLIGLGSYQANNLNAPWNSPAPSTEIAPKDTTSALSAGLNALRETAQAAAVKPASTTPNANSSKVDDFGDEVQVSPTANTRAEVATENFTSQTGQAAITTANVVNESLSKTAEVLTGMKAIVTQLSSENLTRTRRGELSEAFDRLGQHLDSLADTETFAGHRILDGHFRATFSIGDYARVTIDATLPNGKGFNTAGLGLQDYPALLAATNPNPETRAALVRGIDIAQSAVAQVRAGLHEASTETVEAMNTSSKLLSAAIGGTPALAQNLVTYTVAQLGQSGGAALSAQANTAISYALRLLA